MILSGCLAKRQDYIGVDCQEMYESCVTRCRAYGDAPQPDRDIWPAGGNCFYRCETKYNNCRRQN